MTITLSEIEKLYDIRAVIIVIQPDYIDKPDSVDKPDSIDKEHLPNRTKPGYFFFGISRDYENIHK